MAFNLDKKKENKKYKNEMKNVVSNSTYSKYNSKYFTEEEKFNLLKDYTAVDNNKKDKLPINAHIRYELHNGGFRRGGFVKNYINLKQNGKRTVILQNKFNKNETGYFSWTVVLEDIKTIWIKNKYLNKLMNSNNDHDNIYNTTHDIKIPTACNDISYPNKENEQIRYLNTKIERLETLLQIKQDLIDKNTSDIAEIVKFLHRKYQH